MRRPSIRKIVEPNLDTSILPHYLLCGCVGNEREGGSSVAKKKTARKKKCTTGKTKSRLTKKLNSSSIIVFVNIDTDIEIYSNVFHSPL